MIVDLNITEYIRSLMKEEKNDLSHIESEARVNHVPIVKPETKELLRTLVLLKKPMKILEVGAAVGFSSLYMNSYQPESKREHQKSGKRRTDHLTRRRCDRDLKRT